MPRGIFNATLIVFVIFEGNMSNFVQNTKESMNHKNINGTKNILHN